MADYKRIVKTGKIVPSLTTIERNALTGLIGGETIYNSSTGKLQYYNGAAWVDASGAGVSAFTDLTDAPASYSGQKDKFVKVKTDESGLEFEDVTPGSEAFTDLTDAPASYVGQNGKFVRVKPDESGLEFVSGSSTGSNVTRRRYTISHGDPGGVLFNITADEILSNVRVFITTPTDTSDATLIVGDAGDTDKFVELGEVDLDIANDLSDFQQHEIYGVATNITAAVNWGTSSVGEIDIVVETFTSDWTVTEGNVTEEGYTIAFPDAGGTITTVTAGKVISNVRVIIRTEADTADTSVIIGDGIDPDYFVEAGEVDMETVGDISDFATHTIYGVDTDIIVAIDWGTASQGEIDVIVEYF